MKTECWACQHFETEAHVSKDGVSYTAICTLDGSPAVKRCNKFCYEPGSDEAVAKERKEWNTHQTLR